MKATAVIVPVKGGSPKERLSPMLSPSQRRQLQLAMLEDTLQTLMKARMVKQAYVVSSNEQILGFVRRFGAKSIPEPADAGVNSAVARALEETSAYDRRMVIPADLPLLSPTDLKAAMMLAREGAEVVISPAEHFDGTNLLLLASGSRIPLHYDDDSFRKHFSDATGRRLRVAVYYSRGVGFDIDRPADVHRFFKYRRAGATLTFLGRTLRRAETKRPRRGQP